MKRGVVAVAAVDQVVALAAEEHVVAEAAVHRELDAVGLEAGGVDDVVAAQPVDDVSRSLAASAKKMFTSACRPNTLTPPASPATPNTSAPLVRVDGDGVGRAVAAAVRARAGRCRPRSRRCR